MLDTETARKKIVFVLPSLNAGGAERVLITLMNELNPEKFDKHLISVQEGGPLKELIKPSIPLHEFGPGKNVFKSLPLLYKTLRSLQPDIVVSTMAHMNFAALLLKPFFPKTTFIVREAVTPSYFMNRGLAQRIIIKTAYRILYPQADLVISPAQAIIDEFSHTLNLDTKKHILLRNPVDVKKIRAVHFCGKHKDSLELVCAGRLDAQKGFDRLIIMLPMLGNNHDWHLTILGEGPERQNLTKLIQSLSLQDKISLPGHASEPWSVIASADAFLMPSRWEGLPNAALEALACGTPVIATSESGGIMEVARDTAEKSLQVFDDMESFIEAVGEITPVKFNHMRPSLLPKRFFKDNVINTFDEIISSIK